MNIGNTVKKAPKWAWYTAGGVAVGAGAIRLWKNRTTSTGDTPLEGSDDPTQIGSSIYGAAGSASSPAGVIVPPVILPASNSESGGTGLNDLQALYMGGVGNLLDQFQLLFGQDEQHYQDWVGANQGLTGTLTTLLMDGGSAPAPASQVPTPVVVNVPTPAATPAVTAQSPQPTTSRTCRSLYPDYPEHDSNFPVGPSGCYKEGCNSKGHKTWYFKSGRVNVLSPVRKCG